VVSTGTVHDAEGFVSGGVNTICILLRSFTRRGALLVAVSRPHMRTSIRPAISIRDLDQIQKIVDEYQEIEVLEDYRNGGILVRFNNGRASDGPALTRRIIVRE